MIDALLTKVFESLILEKLGTIARLDEHIPWYLSVYHPVDLSAVDLVGTS
jgi:hypothetical protein